MVDYGQFRNMKMPTDIKEESTFTKEEVKEIVNNKRRDKNLSQIPEKYFYIINYNSHQFRPNEINIITTDLFNYEPDFDFSFKDEADPWRRACKIKMQMQRFKDVDFVRMDKFIPRLNVCEALTLFEDTHKILRDGGILEFLYPDIQKWTKLLQTASIVKLEKLEEIIFANSDSTGLYHNQSLWNRQRVDWYLKFAKFQEIKENEKYSDNIFTCINAVK